MVIGRPAMKEKIDKVELNTSNEIIKQKSQFKILGFLTNRRLSPDSHLNHVTSLISYRINQFNSLKKYASENIRKKYAVSSLLSVLEYGMPLYADEGPKIKLNVHRNIMRIARFIRASYCFKKSTNNILSSVGIDDSDTMIHKSTAKYIHKIIHTGKPRAVNNLYRKQRTRQCTAIFPKYFSSTLMFDRNLYNSSIKIYNSIPADIRSLPPIKFKKKLDQLSKK